MNNLTLEQIFNRSEEISYTQKYNYIEQTNLNGKTSMFKGPENLRKIPLKIKLHHSFCKPQNIINEIENKAKARTVINYYQKGKYMGEFVIADFKVNINQIINNDLIYAEIEVTLLQAQNNAASFSQQSKKNNLSLQSFSSDSNIIKSVISQAEESFSSKFYDIALSQKPSKNLSSDASLILDKLKKEAIEDIKLQGLYYSNDIVQKYINDLNNINILSSDEISTIKYMLNEIPKTLIKTSIRQPVSQIVNID